jgi:hypothetical protein
MGSANATATADVTGAGVAQATATALGASGTAMSVSIASGGAFLSGTVTGSAPASPNGDSALTTFSVGQVATPLMTGSGVQAVAFFTGSPLASDVNAALAGKTNVTGAGISAANSIALVVMGGAYATSGSGSAATFGSTIKLTLGSFQGGTLKIGFLGTDAAAHPFDSITFTLSIGGATPINQSFSTLLAAQNYFQNQVVSLGGFSGDTTLAIQWSLTSHTAGDMYDAQFVIADVPEPGDAWLLLFAAPLLGIRRRADTTPTRS